jgi:hypothetical protein
MRLPAGFVSLDPDDCQPAGRSRTKIQGAFIPAASAPSIFAGMALKISQKKRLWQKA